MSSTEIKVPTVGESISEVTIASWTKKDGEYVELDELICELESDKATFELNAEKAGILKIKVEEGDTVEIGAVIAEIEEGDGGGKAEEKSSDSKEEKSEPKEEKSSGGKSETVEMKVPAVGESITEVTISEWLKKTGDKVELDEVLCEIESDKATFELTAEAAGILTTIAEEGDTVSIGDPVCKIETSAGGGSSSDKPKEQKEKSGSTGEGSDYAEGHASPAAAKILAEKGISASEVKGTGKDGRITKEDALAAKKEEKKEESKKEAPKKEAAPVEAKGERNQRREKMSNLRKTISKRLVSVKNETAMLTTFNEVDMKPIMDLRKKYKDSFKEKHGVGLGFMSFFTKACTVALQEWPAVNAYIDGDQIVYNDYCDVSIAVSAPKGLVVPVIRNAEKLSFAEVESEVIRLAVKARDNKLSIDEMTGGTFTITNGGIFGSMLSTPIINAPQSAILGMHNIVERPVVQNGEVVVRPIMYVALSYDHRIIDGKESVSFLVRVKQLLEDPARLMLNV